MNTNQANITPFLWFNDNIDDALKIYADIFSDFKIQNKSPWGHKKDKTMSATIRINNQNLILFDGGPMFSFNPSVSLFVNCKTQEEVDFFWDKFLTHGGKESRCGWLTDKFGLSWQIIPELLGQLLGDKDPVKAQKVMQSMMTMNKIKSDELLKAYES